MLITEEKSLLVLLSLWDLEGQATKARVLDNIENRHYCQFTPHELSWKHNRKELVWRNNLAFIRKKLLDEGYLDDPARNCWTMTSKGKNHLVALCHKVVNSRSFKRLTSPAVERCKEALEKQ